MMTHDDNENDLLIKKRDDACGPAKNASLSSSSKWVSLLQLLSSLKIEPMCAFALFGMILRLVAGMQLVQDKICIQEFNKSLSYCLELSKSADHEDKNQILAATTTFGMRKELISMTPNILMSFFIGSWCDRFRSGRRYILLATNFANFLECVILALNSYYFDWSYKYFYFTSLPVNLTANGFFIATNSYIARNNPSKNRAFRFILLDIMIMLTVSMGFYLGGEIMSSNHPWIHNPLHNYTDCFVLGAASYVLLFFWIYFLIESQDVDPEFITDNNNETERNSFCHQLGRIFSLSHIKGAFKVIVKKRPDNFHKTLWLMVLLINVTNLPQLGSMYINFPFVQKLYKWDYDVFSKVETFATTLRPVATLIIIPVIFKVFKPRNLQISMIGVTSCTLAHLSMASFINPISFLVGIGIGLLTNIGSLGIKAFLTDHIPGNEISRIFSLLQTCDVLQPLVGSFIYSSLFKLTIDSYPTFIFHFIAFLLILVLAALSWADIRYNDPVKDKGQAENTSIQSKIETSSTGDED